MDSNEKMMDDSAPDVLNYVFKNVESFICAAEYNDDAVVQRSIASSSALAVTPTRNNKEDKLLLLPDSNNTNNMWALNQRDNSLSVKEQ